LLHKDVENQVLGVYKRVNPSLRKIEESDNIFKSQMDNRRAILHELCLPDLLFMGKRVLEIGGGTGENSLYYAMNGAKVTIVEPNEISCSRAKEIFRMHNLHVQVINKSLFDLDANILKEFDIVIAEGVIHHTHNTMRALKIILDGVRVDSLVVIAIPEYHGWFKRYLQRLLVSISSQNENEIVFNAKKFFQSHLDRAVKYGLREEENVIYDTFVNPQIEVNKLKDILKVFFENDIEYYSSYPTLNLFNETSPWSKTKVNRFDYAYYEPYYKILEKVWMCSGEESLSRDMQDFKTFLDRLDRESSVLFDLELKILNNEYKSEDLLPIQNGYLGQGMNYFVGVKK